MQSAAEHSKSNDSKVRGPTCILDGRLSMREIPSQSREVLEVRFIPLASTCPVAWRCLMRHVSLHPSSFALPPGLRPRSNGHRRMPRQNRLRPSPHSLRKICRGAMGEAGGEVAVGTCVSSHAPRTEPYVRLSLSRVHHAIFVARCYSIAQLI